MDEKRWTDTERLEAVQDILGEILKQPRIAHLHDIRGRVQTALLVASYPWNMLNANIVGINKERGGKSSC
jgi:hypothetical protein